MADSLTQEKRSENMAAIRSRDTKPEIFVRKNLFRRGYRYRIAASNVPGHPDLYLAKYNIAIFIHGCFWHRHSGCRLAYTPKSRLEFWNAKFKSNINRDQDVIKMLEKQHIRYLIVWECAIRACQKKNGHPENLIDEIEAFIRGNENTGEIGAL